MSGLMYALPAWGVLCQSNRPIVLMLYSNDAMDTCTLIRFTVVRNSVDLAFLIKCNLRFTVCIHCFPQTEVNLNIHAIKYRGHDFILPSGTKNLYKRSFVMRCLFEFM